MVASGILPDVEGGILPPGVAANPRGHVRLPSAGRDAQLYGRRDACRHSDGRGHTVARKHQNAKASLKTCEWFSGQHDPYLGEHGDDAAAGWLRDAGFAVGLETVDAVWGVARVCGVSAGGVAA